MHKKFMRRVIFLLAALLLFSCGLLVYADSEETEEIYLCNITTDTVCDNSSCTYVLDSDVQIKNGVKLVLASGVTVEGNGNTLFVYGELEAKNCNINNLNIKAANTNYAPCTIRVEGCYFEGGSFMSPSGVASHVYLTIIDNVFVNANQNSLIYIWYPKDVTYIKGNEFYNCGGLSIGSDYDVYVENNLFMGVTTEYIIDDWAQYDNSTCYVRYNSFYDSDRVLKVSIDGKMSAPNNYWNTTDINAIRDRIVDGNTDFSIAETIQFEPIITENHVKTPIHNHNYTGDWILDEAPSCTEEGSKYKKCICGNTVTEEIPVIEHPWNKYFTIDEDSSCTKEGSKSIHCSKCSATKDATVIKKLDHTHGSWITTKAPSCTEVGSKYKKCTCGDTVTEVIPATGHQAGALKVTLKATITTQGKKVSKCTACSEIVRAVVIKAPKVTLSKSGVTYTGKKVKVPVVCVKTTDGKIIPAKYYTVTTPKNVKKMKDIGRYTYTIKFKENCPEYKGIVKMHFEIKPAKATIKAPVATKKAINVKWKPVPKAKKAQVTGYEVQAAANKAFTKGVKKATVKGYAKSFKKVTGLKAKTKYFVKVRTYKTVKGVKIYSEWSKVKNIRTK